MDAQDRTAAAELAGDLTSQGVSPAEAANRLTSDGLGLMDVYRALRFGADIEYVVAKEAVHQSRTPDEREAIEALWDAAENALTDP